MNVLVKQTLRYSMLPGIFPRLKSLFASGFVHIAVFMAYVYAAVRLLPANHPYLSSANAGQFGIRHVIAEARRNLTFDRKNIDQVVIFFTLLIGIVILFMQFGLLLMALTVQIAHAAVVMPTCYSCFFVTPFPLDDIAFTMLDYTFGFDGLYGSFVDGSPGWPTPFHEGLHALFHFYNIGVLIVGLIVFLYFIVTIVAETAQSGTPFGRRFNHAWAPVRLILALGLLFPFTNLWGMNGAQLITLYAAKWGSSVATNGWTMFNEIILGKPTTMYPGGPVPGAPTTPLGQPETLVSIPNPPHLNTLIEFLFVAQTCKWMEKKIHDRDIEGYIVKDEFNFPLAAFTFQDALGLNAINNLNQSQDIVIRFGEVSDFYKREPGWVSPICGEIIVNIKDETSPGTMILQAEYYKLIQDLWAEPSNDFYADNLSKKITPTFDKDPFASMPTASFLQTIITEFNDSVSEAIELAVEAQINAINPNTGQSFWLDDFTDRGWVGAALWYNKIAQFNGSLVAAAFNLPVASRYPLVMERVRDQRRMTGEFLFGPDRYKPYLSNGKLVEFQSAGDVHIAIALYYAQSYWRDRFVEPTGNPFIDTINSIFGLEGLFNIRDNREVHPLALLAGIGRGLVESSVVNLGFSFGTGVMGGIANILGLAPLATVGRSASSFTIQVAMIGLSLGLVLFYVIPFLPFVYFFFGAGGWIKGIFEALVGMPLWALGHLRIDGEGIPGPKGMDGYYLLLEIFLRPILIIFGLIAGMAIFTAQVQILHEVFDLVIENVAGFTQEDMTDGTGTNIVGDASYLTGPLNNFFYTVIYTLVVYMMALSAFKLVDLIPNHILRWIGSSVSTFGEHTQDPARNLVRNAMVGSQAAFGQLGGALGGLMGRN